MDALWGIVGVEIFYVGQSNPMSSVFISYRREDSQFATDRIYEHLARQLDRKEIFKDVDNIPYGVNFRTQIEAAVKGSRVMLAVIGPDWLKARNAAGQQRIAEPDDFVRIEIETALAKGITVIPVLVGGARMPSKAELPVSLQPLSEINAVPVRADPDFTQDVRRLIGAVNGMTGRGSGCRGVRNLAIGAVALLMAAAGGWWLFSQQPVVPPTATPIPVPTKAGPTGPGTNCREIPVVDNSKIPPVTRMMRVCD